MVDQTFLKQNGFFVCPEAISSSEVALLGSAIDDLIGRWQTEYATDSRFWSFPQDGSLVLYRIHRLESLIPFVRDVLNGSTLLSLRDELVGRNSVTTAYAAILKLPSMPARVPWHRDPIETLPGTIFNLSLYLDDSTSDNGCLGVVPGSHLTNQCVNADIEPIGVIPVPASTGDVVVHDATIIHGSAANRGPKRRRSIVVEIQPSS